MTSPIRCNGDVRRIKPPIPNLPNRIWELRYAKEWSREKLAEMADIGPQQNLARYENGDRAFRMDVQRKIARALGETDPYQLLHPEDRPPPRPIPQVDLAGFIGAGDEIYPFDEESRGKVNAPAEMTEGVAVIVHGDSMAPVYREGDMLFAEKMSDPRMAVKCDCLVQVLDGPRLVKRLLPGSKRGHFRLYSYATDTVSDDVQVVEVAIIRWVQRA